MHRSYCTSGGIRLFDLSKDLRFANHHRVKARRTRNTWRTASRSLYSYRCVLSSTPIELEVVVQKARKSAPAPFFVLARISTRLQVERIMPSSIRDAPESLARLRQTRLRDRQPFADLNRRGVVIHADELESHVETNL